MEQNQLFSTNRLLVIPTLQETDKSPKNPKIGVKNPRQVYLRDSILPCKKWKNKAPIVCCQVH